MPFEGFPTKPGDIPTLDEINRLKAEVERLTQECETLRHVCDVASGTRYTLEATDERLEFANLEIERLTQELATERHSVEVSDQTCTAEMVARKIAEAARIDVERKLAMAVEVLKPFANAASLVADGFPDHDIMPTRLGQCRDARAAIAQIDKLIGREK